MKAIFAGCPANEWVSRGLYEIVDENRDTVLESRNWEDVIKPNMMISMNMLLRKKQSGDPENANCPSCGDLYKGYSKRKELERVRW